MTSGLVILDKPAGLTSFDCVYKVSKIFGVKKAGHTGTLDPKVTGVLLILLGETRKLAPLFEKNDKIYVGIMRMHKEFEKSKLEKVIEEFRGEITQIPPVKSRVKRVPRKRKIHKLEIKKIEGQEVTMLIECEHGTYIRKLFSDMGEKMGTGAHMSYLRRTAVNNFREDEAITLEKLKENKDFYLMTNEEILSRMKIRSLDLPETFKKTIENGVPVSIKKSEFSQGETVALLVEGKLRAIGQVDGDIIKMIRVLNLDDKP